MIRGLAAGFAVALVLAVPALAGGGATTIKISADKIALKFNVKTLSAKAGKVTIVMIANPSPLPHNVAIKGKGLDVKGPVVGKGKTSTVSATLKAGTYTFYCSVPGHEAGGMKGTLKVK